MPAAEARQNLVAAMDQFLQAPIFIVPLRS